MKASLDHSRELEELHSFIENMNHAIANIASAENHHTDVVNIGFALSEMKVALQAATKRMKTIAANYEIVSY